MSVTITNIIIRQAASSPFGALSTGLGILAVALLIILLIERSLLEAYRGPKTQKRLEALNLAIVPFLIVLSLLTFLRIGQILHFL